MKKMFGDFFEKIASFSSKGRESIPLCSLSHYKKPIDVFVVHYSDNPHSKRLQFKKGSRVLLEVFLLDVRKDLQGLYQAIEAVQCDISFEKNHLDILNRVFLRILGRKIISCSMPLCTSKRNIDEQKVSASFVREYYIVKLSGWFKSSIVILQNIISASSSPHRSGKRLGINWVRLHEDDCVMLKKSITNFLESNINDNITKEVNQ
jgi:hypothetical protein